MIPEDLEIALKEMKQVVCKTLQECLDVLKLIQTLDLGFDFDEYTTGLMDGIGIPNMEYLCPGLSYDGSSIITCYNNGYAKGLEYSDVMQIAALEQEPDMDEGVGAELVSGLFSMLM